jgi:hypothetical protein
VLQSIEDVTKRVNSAVKPGISNAEAQTARNAEISRISEESTKQTGLRSDVVTLYQGGQYNLYRYKIHGRAARLRARISNRFLRRRSRQLRVSALRFRPRVVSRLRKQSTD